MFGPEYARACGIAALEPLGVYLPGDKNYPGEGSRLKGCVWQAATPEGGISGAGAAEQWRPTTAGIPMLTAHHLACRLPSHLAGGWLFDPLGLSKDAERYERMRVREIKNGRLAMVAWVGFAAQAAVTREGPVQNLVDALQPLRSQL